MNQNKQMNKSFLIFFLSILLMATSCKRTQMRGLYVCDVSQKKPETRTISKGNVHIEMDITCMIESLDFKGDSSVLITMNGSGVASSYVVDGEYIRIKGTGADLLYKIKDDATLVGEGIFKGTYNKK